jgi:hypothetical protein
MAEQSSQKKFQVSPALAAGLVGLSAGALAYVLLHLAGKLGSMGAEGGNVAQIWSFIIAILELASSIVATVIAVKFQRSSNKESGTVAQDATAIKRKIRPQHIVIGASIAIIAFVVPPAINKFAFRHWSAETITQSMMLYQQTDMESGAWAYAKLPDTKHAQLEVQFRLVSEQTTGSCVAPARMRIVPIFNNNQGRAIDDVRSGDIRTIALPDDVTGEKWLAIGIENDPYCTVNLTVQSAKYKK